MHSDSSPATREQIAWAAGLFEGEGCMNATRAGARGSGAQLRLGMTDLDVVERFASVMGCGKMYVHKPGSDSWKPVHTWYLYEAAKVVEILELLMPHFGERRSAKAAEVLAVAWKIGVHKGKRTHCTQGHPYAGDNLMLERITRGEKTYFARRCRICRTAQDRSRKARQRS